LVGFFVNTLVMRTDTSGNPVFRELLKQVRKSTLDAYAYQDLPFEKLIMELKPERDLSRNPIFQVMFILQNVPISTLELPALTVNRIWVEDTMTKFDLEVHLRETAEGLKCSFVYNTDLFDRATIERMAGHYQIMLEEIAANPDQRLSELPLLTEAERHQLIVEWNNTSADYPRDKCIHELFEEQVEKTPDAIAVVFEDEQLTYRELNAKTNQLAYYLRKQGVGPEVLVGICVQRSLEMIVGILGILKAGGAYLPLDPDYPMERLEFMVEDAAVPVLLTQKHLAAMLPETSTKVVFLDTDKDVLALGNKCNPAIAVKPENLAYVIYTSGSTGKPKGVMISHMALCNHMVWMQEVFPLIPADKVLQKTLFTFDASVWEFFAPLLAGASLIVAAPEDHRDSALLIETIKKQQVTVLQVVPSLLNMLIEDNAIEKCKSLRRVFCGGEVLPVRLCERFLMISNADLINLYGPTESCIDATFRIVSGRQTHDTISIGRPISNTQLYILDKHLQPVPIGVQGELCLSGNGLARGYLNNPELTAQKFIPNPFSEEPGAHLYKTGDLVRYLPDGNVEYSGRIDNQVKIRGFRIELGEIESVLAQHQSVREAVVVTREAMPGDRQLVAYVVPAEAASLSVSSLKDFLSHKLPSYMIPSFFVLLDALPLTPNGKIDRKALPAPDRTGLITKENFVSSGTPTEEIIAGIWAEVLGLNQVGIHDNFFELGGHSLLATQVVSRLRKVFEIEIPLRTLFESPTVEKLAFALLQRASEREKVEQRATLLQILAGLSEDEVNTMLAEQIRERHNKINE
jgi:amino acid adenylation domain-containing protein